MFHIISMRTARENLLLGWLGNLKYDGLPLCIIAQWAEGWYEDQLILDEVEEEYAKL